MPLWRQLIGLAVVARPLVLTSCLVAYAVGLAWSYRERGSIAWDQAALGLSVTLLANIMAHFVDEYADMDTDAITQRTWFSGGSGFLPSGQVPPGWALRAGLICGVLTLIVCGAGIAKGMLPWSALWVAVIGLIGGWIYSMPPLALERHGFGEIDNALLGGILMPLMAYLSQGNPLRPTTLIALVPVVASVLVCVISVHWADRVADAAVGKYTLAVIFKQRTRIFHHGSVLLTYGGLLVVAAAGLIEWKAALTALLTLPLGLYATITFGKHDQSPASVLTMGAVMVALIVGNVLVR